MESTSIYGSLNQVKEAKERELLAQLKQQAINTSTQIQTIGTVVLKRKLGENGKIFGTVTPKQIVEELKSKSGGKGVACFPVRKVKTSLH